MGAPLAALRTIRLASATFALSLIVTSVARAQEGGRNPGEFFPPNYATEYQGGPKPTPTKRLLQEKRPTPKQEEDSFFGDRSGFFRDERESAPEATPTPKPLVRGSSQKVISVSGFVAGKTAAEAIMSIAEAGRILQERKLPVRHVSIVADPLAFAGEVTESFKAISQNSALMNGFVWMSPVLRIIREVPERYQVTISPVWLIETAEGESIIEGEGPSLEDMISPEGEFFLPSGGEEVKQLPPPPAKRN